MQQAEEFELYRNESEFIQGSIKNGAKMDSKHFGALIRPLSFGALMMSALLPASAGQSTTAPASAAPVTRAGGASRYHPSHFPKRAHEYYELIWGVDSLRVKAAESGELIRFTYHVNDPEKAKALNDKEIEALLNSPERHVQLVIPSLEKVGKLRQTGSPEADTSYWMAFSNPRRQIRRGDRVNVVIGRFHADGLIVE